MRRLLSTVLGRPGGDESALVALPRARVASSTALMREDGALCAYVVAAAPTVYEWRGDGPPPTEASAELMRALALPRGPPLALLFKLAADGGLARDSSGAPLARWALYVADDARALRAEPSLLMDCPAAAVAALRDRLRDAGRDPDAPMYAADGRTYAVAPLASRKRPRSEEPPPLLVAPAATFGDVAAAYLSFLLEDARVPSEARRVAAGLAPYLSERRTHYGRAGGGMFAPTDADAPYDAAAILKRARATTWANPGDLAVVSARVNASQSLFNTLFCE